MRMCVVPSFVPCLPFAVFSRFQLHFLVFRRECFVLPPLQISMTIIFRTSGDDDDDDDDGNDDNDGNDYDDADVVTPIHAMFHPILCPWVSWFHDEEKNRMRLVNDISCCCSKK